MVLSLFRQARFLAAGLLFFGRMPISAAKPAENLIVIVSDGLRWQEVFTGAEERLLNLVNGGIAKTNLIREAYWRDTPDARRVALMPFVWSMIAQRGQLWGNQLKGSIARVRNGHNFSYPGYNEMLTGHADPRIDTNNKVPNPNTNVFEWLNERPKFKGRIAAFGTWDVFPYIFNRERCRFPIFAGFEPVADRNSNSRQALLSELTRDTTHFWEDVIPDSFHFHAVQEYMRESQPRALFVGFGETDEWCHSGRYDRLLHATHNVDDFIRRIWETCQQIPQYRDNTLFIITADHGRGGGLQDWRNHGADTVGSDAIWLATFGPGIAPLGERSNTPLIYQDQIAATAAKLLGEDYRAAIPQAGKPIAELISEEKSP